MGMAQTIVIGGSAGALDALLTILPWLPATFPIPIVLVLHLPAEKPSHLAEVLARHSALSIKEVEDKDPTCRAMIHVAPPNYHVLLERDGSLALSVDQPVLFSRPSIDVLFESAAEALGPSALGLLLTGASEDGARGLHRIRNAGGRTIVQSPTSALVRTMPEAALSLDARHDVLPLDRIGPYLATLAHPTTDKQ